MPIPERFILWPNDSALNAVDDVSGFIANQIDETIADCDESDSSSLNEVVAYMCCLSAVANSFSGLTSQYARVENWRAKVLEIFDWSWASDQKNEQYFEERRYVCSVLNSLFEAVDHSTTPNAREPWSRC
jgi:hypothetical protein